MVVESLLCALATAGILLFVWCLVGALLFPVGQEAVLVYCIAGEAKHLESYLRWIGWLCQSGLLRVEIMLVDCGLSDEAKKRASYLAEQDSRVIQLCSEDDLRTKE